ncbi:putative spermidine/putrescine transport system permease protein [Rhizobium sp. BK077]|uniref:ABC transporter permease n=1 Tax=unclassified Rhizobium TaxID=2613769 RepID=UPI00160D8B94|nr:MULTISPECIES: ABC transporter permease subunit [unclassified Rhizobium]MBB3302197.1 putative spermidine/putrescine transport system permease protein [Rhizobium sp. BK112]MBB3371319.1 putative spermidine/putrescine transport system permease protein [Rhizobium sp. BK077]MBB4182193.1 putative spermidine/putrescine transport system permease protein [Rhizobium sp. BK109]MBB4255622.1 putative spermidine/putrescine transport system permease protein [Rhizobium sp. BK008]
MNARASMHAYLLLIPGLGLIVAFTGVVIGMAISQSFGYLNFSGEGRFSTQFWQATTADPQLWKAFRYSARIALISTILAVALAYPLALWLRKPFPGSSLISAVLKAPLLVHGLVVAFLFINFISFQGFFNLALVKLGIVARPLRLQNDPYGIGVVVLQVWKQMPFALLILTGAVQAIGDDILNAARDLGAGSWSRFRKVIVPLTLRSLQAALILIFIGAAGDFSFQVVAGPTNVNSMAQFMFQVQEAGNEGWNTAAVVAVLLMSLSLFGCVILAGVTQLVARLGRGA